MEWNLKAPLQWDWENQALFSGKDSEITKFTAQAEWRAELAGVINNGSMYSSCSGTCSGSDPGNGSSRSSFSASVGSSKVGVTVSELNFEPVEGLHQNLVKNNKPFRGGDTGTSPVMIGSSGAGEPPIGLKLGKRTYFEDFGSANIKISSSISMTPDTDSVKSPRMSHQANQSTYCQVEGCRIDLVGAKDYHRKHKVCESHSKSPKVTVAGQERRFCQQCSRFHDLSEFDQKKRSCRKRLSEHNSRRRKPQPETISFNSNGLPSSFCANGKQMNFFLSRAPVSHVGHSASNLWQKPSAFSLSTTEGSWPKPSKTGVGGTSSSSVIDFSDTLPASHCFNRIMPFKGTLSEVLNQGLESSVSTSSLNGAPDLGRALSLLSTDSCGPGNTGQANMFPFVRTNSFMASYPPVQEANSLPECWHDDEHSLTEQALVFNFHCNGSQFQEFHLSKVPYESPLFESNQVFPKSDGHFLEFKT